MICNINISGRESLTYSKVQVDWLTIMITILNTIINQHFSLIKHQESINMQGSMFDCWMQVVQVHLKSVSETFPHHLGVSWTSTDLRANCDATESSLCAWQK